MSEPLVSVVIPVYNGEKYLDRCIDSVLDQTYKNLEIILVDDGSVDSSPELCDLWCTKDNRISVIHKENTGAGLSRNTGMDCAKGEYVAFVDCDDYIDPTTLEKCICRATEDNSDVVLFGTCNVSADGKLSNKTLNPSKLKFVGDEVLSVLLPGLFSYQMGYGIGLPTKIFRLDTIRKSKVRIPSEREVVSEDAFFILQLFASVSTVSLINENLYFYFDNAGSYSRSFDTSRKEKNDVFLESCMDFAQSAGYPQNVLCHIQIRYHSYIIAYMKQILASDYSKKEKKSELYSMFKNPTLRQTLSREVLKHEKKSLRMFFTALRYKLYFFCYLLLVYRMHSGA